MSDAPSAVRTPSVAPQPPARALPAADAERRGDWRERSPILVFCAVTLAGYVLLAAVMIGLGFLLVDIVLPYHGIGGADESVNGWLAAHRSPGLSDASYLGSAIGDIPFVPGLVILTALVTALLRKWRAFAFIIGAILVEVATYRVTSLVVHRQRPSVPRLNPDHLPVNQSYPSGHVAAAVVVYIGLALLLSRRVRDRRVAIPLWTLAIVLPLVVALSRMYRGMHHPIDATAGVFMGAAAIAIALVATRAAGEAARERS
jgi:membrane-associated phospholipid phosphatase